MTTDVQAKNPAVMTEFEPHLQAWHTELDESNQGVQDRTQEQEDALRALGYIE